MAVSAAGKRKFAAFGVVLALDAVVFALSLCVNIYHSFFYIADLLPLVLSMATLVIFPLSILLDITSRNSWSARPQFEIPFFAVLTFAWIGLNIFSTFRWSNVPLTCSPISTNQLALGTWCLEFQVLRVMIWGVAAALLILTLTLIHVVIGRQSSDGTRQAWKTPISRYDVEDSESSRSSKRRANVVSSFYGGSSSSITDMAGFSSKGDPSIDFHDYFAASLSGRTKRTSASSSDFDHGGRNVFGAYYFPRVPDSPAPAYVSRQPDEFEYVDIVAGLPLEDPIRASMGSKYISRK